MRPGLRAADSGRREPARPPAVAGQFYPAQPNVLADLVDRLVDAVELPDDELPDGLPDDGAPAPAYVVPHAGYRYSGPTAGFVYARLRRYAGAVQRVVLLGPAHRVPLRGCAVPVARRWRTPLGEVTIDAAAGELAAAGLAVADDRPHAPEHSLEVQLPFLQRVLAAGVPVLPVAVGSSTVDDVRVTIEAAAGVAGTVVLCSTDLSHYLSQQAAREQDDRTVQAVLELAPERIGVRDACGVFALRGLLGWARQHRLTPRLLQVATSADTAGDPQRVVGYSALSFS
jgi:AmmeMemoRadiSam system protein B